MRVFWDVCLRRKACDQEERTVADMGIRYNLAAVKLFGGRSRPGENISH
jgi:hypothetical protein